MPLSVENQVATLILKISPQDITNLDNVIINKLNEMYLGKIYLDVFIVKISLMKNYEPYIEAVIIDGSYNVSFEIQYNGYRLVSNDILLDCEILGIRNNAIMMSFETMYHGIKIEAKVVQMVNSNIPISNKVGDKVNVIIDSLSFQPMQKQAKIYGIIKSNLASKVIRITSNITEELLKKIQSNINKSDNTRVYLSKLFRPLANYEWYTPSLESIVVTESSTLNEVTTAFQEKIGEGKTVMVDPFDMLRFRLLIVPSSVTPTIEADPLEGLRCCVDDFCFFSAQMKHFVDSKKE